MSFFRFAEVYFTTCLVSPNRPYPIVISAVDVHYGGSTVVIVETTQTNRTQFILDDFIVAKYKISQYYSFYQVVEPPKQQTCVDVGIIAADIFTF